MTIRLNGQTSGYVELEAPATAGSNTLVLPTNNGSSGQYLQTNGSGGLSWQTLAGGKILQITQGTQSTIMSTTSQTYQDTNLSASITPSASDSKVLVLVTQPTSFSIASNAAQGAVRLVRGSTSIWEPGSSSSLQSYANGASTVAIKWLWSLMYLDSPATTSATTYKTQIKTYSSSITGYAQNDSSPSWMYLVEVAA